MKSGYSNMNIDSNDIGYEYKPDVSNSYTNSDIYSIWKIIFTNFLY
jgi:hypothetical protein